LWRCWSVNVLPSPITADELLMLDEHGIIAAIFVL
jgi:hypothetical protein